MSIFNDTSDEILEAMRQNIMQKHLSKNNFFMRNDPDCGRKAVLTAPLPSSTHYIAESLASRHHPINVIIEEKKFVAVPDVKVIVTEFLPSRTVQAKRHKRKSSRRWQKKWLKRFGTKQVRDSEIFKIGNTILISPEMNRAITKRMSNRISDAVDAQMRMLWGF